MPTHKSSDYKLSEKRDYTSYKISNSYISFIKQQL